MENQLDPVDKKFRILKDIEKGQYSLRQLARKYGCSIETIMRIKKNGWNYRPHGNVKHASVRSKIIDLYEMGLNHEEIAAELNNSISINTIRKVLHKSDPQLEGHLIWYFEEGRWDLFQMHIDKLYTFENIEYLTRVPDELLPDHLLTDKYIRIFYDLEDSEVSFKYLRQVLAKIHPSKLRSRAKLLSFIIYLLPQLNRESRNSYMEQLQRAHRLFEANRNDLRLAPREFHLLALSSNCLHLLHSNDKRFIECSESLIRGIQKITNPCIRNALTTRLRLMGFPQFADMDDPGQVISVLFSGNFEKVKTLYEQNKHSDSEIIINRLNYAMFYVNLFQGRLEEAKHFINKLIDARTTPGVSRVAIQVAESNLLMAQGKKRESLEILKPLIEGSKDLSILFGIIQDAHTPRHRIAHYYQMGKLKEAHRLARKYHLTGLLMIIIITRPKHIARLANIPDLKPLYHLLSGKDLRVRVYLLKRKPRILYLRERLDLTRDQSIFLLKFLDTNQIVVPRTRLRRYRKIINMLKNSCTINTANDEDQVKLHLKERNLYYDVQDFESIARRAMIMEEQGQLETANQLKKKARKLIQAIPFFQEACKDVEASYILDRLLNYMRFVNA